MNKIFINDIDVIFFKEIKNGFLVVIDNDCVYVDNLVLGNLIFVYRCVFYCLKDKY